MATIYFNVWSLHFHFVAFIKFKSAMKIKSESYVVLFCQSSQTSLSAVFVMFRTEATIGGWPGTVVVRQPPRPKLKEVVVNWRGWGQLMRRRVASSWRGPRMSKGWRERDEFTKLCVLIRVICIMSTLDMVTLDIAAALSIATSTPITYLRQ